MKRSLRAFAFLTAAIALPASAQVFPFDSSGNGQLNGNYFFREVLYDSDPSGFIGSGATLYGMITFTGSGGYSGNVTLVDTNTGQQTSSYGVSGTYSISVSGYGFMSHPYLTDRTLSALVNKDKLLVGSSPDSRTNDMFVAVPVTSVSNATMNGSYSIAYFNTLGGTYTSSYNTSGILTTNAAGNIGNVDLKSYLGNQAAITQTETGVTYSFSSNVGTLRFPTSNNPAIGGDKVMYISPDGNFIFGGAPRSSTNANILDFYVGVRRGSVPAATMNGLFYQIGLNHNPNGLDTFFGGFIAAGSGTILDHQRFFAAGNVRAINYMAKALYPETATTAYVDLDSLTDYVIDQTSSIRIGTGQSPYLGIRVGLRALDASSFTPTGSAPYIHPMGITNSASYAAFTSGVAPGELINVYGANFATGTTQVTGGIPFPTTLDGVQVFVNGRLAPLYFVTPGQIAAIVPYATVEPVVQFQVQKNGVLSNTVTSFLYLTDPGIFAVSRNGVGPGAILHANAPDYTVVSPAAPALIGETVQVFATGLGQVLPTIPDGGLGASAEPFNRTPGSVISARVGGKAATVTYSGLAPFLAGLYQVNVTIPAGVASGDVFMDIVTPGAQTSQVTINVAPAPAARSSDALPSTVDETSAEPQPLVRRR